MVLVPTGTFTMGSEKDDDEKLAHSVTLDAFHIDQYEVANARFLCYTLPLPPAGNYGLGRTS
jgi:formylglycine-generating enzyme required for sulfatase activity